MRRTLHMSVCLAALMAAPGCFWVTTKKEGRDLRQDVDDLEVRLAKKEEDVESRVARLQEVLDEATSLLKRNSADLGADVASMNEEQRKLRGLVTEAQRYANEIRTEAAEMKKQLVDLDERLARAEFKLEEVAKKPPDPDELWKKAKAAYDSGDLETAETELEALVIQFPSHERAGQAQFLRGEAAARSKNGDKAISRFQRVWDRWPDSSVADDAMYRAGEIAQRLKRCAEARAYFGLLGQKYPKSEHARKAGNRVKAIGKILKNRKKCLQ